MNGQPQWRNSRRIVCRVVITGTLVLDTPAGFGNGDTEALTDIPLLRDAVDGAPLLTGASLAGALRSYLREYDGGYGAAAPVDQGAKSRSDRLFGHLDDSAERRASVQSWLAVDDAWGRPPARGLDVELRDGVSIDAATRTAKVNAQGRGQKYDYELLAAGTRFDLCFELGLTAEEQRSGELLGALVAALNGFMAPAAPSGGPQHVSGAIGLGLRKRRGLGACHVEGWRTCIFDVTKPRELIAWLDGDRTEAQAGLPVAPAGPDVRQALQVVARFDLLGSLLIRSASGADAAPDMVHLRSWRNGEQVPILPGTSVAGAIRGRALRIANTVLGSPRGGLLVDAIFGRAIGGYMDTPSGSLLTVAETQIEGGVADRVQNRVKIDRFTGGAYPGALFSQQPLWSVADDGAAGVVLELSLHRPTATAGAQAAQDFAAGAGLLLLVLKDLWTGDLALGGESGAGRGRLAGRQAWLAYAGSTWMLASDRGKPESVAVTGDRSALETWVAAFEAWSSGGVREAEEGAA